jgi:hypothetical protein
MVNRHHEMNPLLVFAAKLLALAGRPLGRVVVHFQAGRPLNPKPAV